MINGELQTSQEIKKEIMRGEVVRGHDDFYLDILASIPSSILIIDSGLKVVSVNRNFLVKSRKDEGEVLGRRIGEVFPQVILNYTNLEEKLRSVFQTAQPFRGDEMEYRAPGLAYRVYFYSLTPLKDEGGMVKDVMLLMDDVTEKKRLGERVMRAERHLASVVESVSDIIVSIDADGLVMTWNNAAERILGFSTHEVVRKPFNHLFLEEDRNQFQPLFNRLTQGKNVQDMELNIVTKGGNKILISWRWSPMKDETGQITALVGVGRDLTEKNKLELQLVQSAKMAALGEMAGGIAHEIRNPLAITSSAAQILERKGDNPCIREECTAKIKAAAVRAATIIENLLRFARPSEGLSEMVDINSTLEDTLSLIEHQVSLQGIEIEKNLDQLPKVKGNKNQLQQVFMNIILNAYHAMPNGGRFTIETHRRQEDHGGQVDMIAFSDTGRGIPKKNLPRIFDPFFTTMPVGKGTGLGLSIAYSIIQNHNGCIRADSRPGEGTTFNLTLPTYQSLQEGEGS
ncbi:MAG: PAS domain-containing protein [Thermodesulfobacteriota bacterium]